MLIDSEPKADHKKPHPRTLDQLAPGERASVRRVRGGGAIHRRILDMGLSRGTTVEVECEAPLRDPIKIKVRGYALSLRKSEARMVEIEPVA
jgi:ferrous iron transport protein A